MIDLINELEENNIGISLVDEELELSFDNQDVNSDLIQKVRENKQQLIEYISKYTNKNNVNEIACVPEEENYPVSNAQKRLWILSQNKESSIAYNLANTEYLNGTYDKDIFSKAILSVIGRHEILRTVFKENAQGEIRQWIVSKEEVAFNLDYYDFRDEANKEEKVNYYISENSCKPFDLENGPLLQASLLQVEDDQYVFYYNMHHIISDGWSMGVLTNDVITYYESFLKGVDPNLSTLRIQYKDYATWQLSQEGSQEYLKSKNYWLDQLSGELPLLNLPSQKSRPRIATNNGYNFSTYISSEATSKLKKFSKENGGSLFMGLLAVWNILVYKYTSQEDIITGTAIAGRDQADLENQIGFYINTLALRNKINPEDDFKSVFAQVKQSTLAAFSNRTYPFDKIVEESKHIRDTSRNPIFDVMFALQNELEHVDNITLDEEAVNTIQDIGPGASMFDLTINFEEVSSYLLFQVTYNTDVYSRDLIEGLMNNFKHLLNTILSNPLRSVYEFDYLSLSEVSLQLDTFNDTDIPYPSNTSIVDVFSTQVSETPDAIALSFEDTSLTYLELEEKSNQLAHYLLLNYKIDIEDFVGVRLDKSEWTIISLLAILKTGGVYVPIDPNYPAQRISYIESDSNCKVTIDESLLTEFSNSSLKYPVESPEVTVLPNNLAYVMYTSGSTGMPKGVMIEHRSVIRLVKNSNFYNFSTNEILLSTGSFSFDAATFEYWGPLLNGATLVLCSQDTLLDIDLLSSCIASEKVTVMWFTAGWLHQLVDTDITLFKGLSTVLVGGDRLSPYHIGKLRDEYPLLEIINGYGPTENTTFSLTYNITDVDGDIPIGYPISNSKAYVLDEHQNLVARGVLGEIYLGGDGLSRGYLNQPELTAEKFVENRFRESKKLYKTGDIGYWLPDGRLCFAGRKDAQVKIRGYRIELTEIESCLLEQKAIEQAVVVVKDIAGQKVIVAYYSSQEVTDKKYIQARLREDLPSYMLPSYYVELSNLPLNPNGKVDRKALPSVRDSDIIKEEYVAPESNLEKQLVSIWEEVLENDTIGVKDDFFALGGHSIKATKLINEYQKAFGTKLTISELFENSTLDSHANLICNSEKVVFQEIEKAKESESYPLSSAQHRIWVSSQFGQTSVSYNMPMSVSLNNGCDIKAFKKAIYAVIERHEILRTVFKEDKEGDVRQWILTPSEIDFKIDYKDFRSQEFSKDCASEYIKEDSYKIFDLEKGPLLRSSLLQVSDDEYVFYYNMHHIISDGWSMEVLATDLMTYYEAYSNNTIPTLQDLKIQYKDYTIWKNKQLHSSEFEGSETYWLNQFNEEISDLTLSIQKNRPKFKNNIGKAIKFEISSDNFEKLFYHIKETKTTFYMNFMALVSIVLYRYSSQNKFAIGSPVSGRTHHSLKNQIGLYINTLALKMELQKEDHYSELLERTKNTIIAGHKHKAYPFDVLVQKLGLGIDVSKNQLFNSMVVVNQYDDIQNDTEIEEYAVEDSQSKFDMSFHFDVFKNKVVGNLEFNSSLFEEEAILKLIKDLKTVLKTTMENKNVTVFECCQNMKEEKVKKEHHSFVETMQVAYDEDF